MLMGFALLVAAFMHHAIGYGVPTPEYLYPAVTFGEQHHIVSVFLPVGYSGFLGLGMMLNHAAGISLANFIIFLSLMCAVWAFLRHRGITPWQAAAIAAIVAASPELSVSIFKVADGLITAMFLLAVMACILAVVHKPQQWLADVVLAAVLGWAIATRTNLAPLVLVCWFIWKRYNVPRLALRIALQTAIIVMVYAGITTAVHGRPFLPHNGAYNLFAGANEFTPQYIDSEEDSLPSAMAARGMPASVHWDTEPDRPGTPDLRDRSFEPIFRRDALAWIRAHPFAMLIRIPWRLAVFLEPDLRVHPANTFGGVLKLLGFIVVPLWFGVWLWLPRTENSPARTLVALTVAAYILPFVLIVSAPRFRVPLEIVCLADLLAMLFAWWGSRSRHSAI